MKAPEPLEESPGAGTPVTTLGDVLYAKPGPLVAESDWAQLVASVAAGNEAALHALYDRAHRVVFTLALRIGGSRETAEEITLDVFHDVWRRAAAYDPANGTVLGWIMNQARSRAIDRVRFEQRKKRVDPHEDDADDMDDAGDPRELLELKQRDGAVHAAMAVLTADERQAIECAFFGGFSYSEVAVRLNEPLGTIKTRIRSALRKLRRAMDEGAGKP